MKWLLVLLSLSVSLAQAGEAAFITNEAHCTLLKQHAVKAITAKTAGVSYVQYVRERVEEGYALSTAERVVFTDMIPYTLEMAYEYFHNDFDLSTPYESVIERNCLANVGRTAE